MAQRPTEAWITSALNDDAVPNAMVLAESIRRTRTTRKIGVISSNNVSLKYRCALRKIFDVVLFIKDGVLLDNTGKSGSIEAELFALSSLNFFSKCVFISSSCMLVENADNLFEDSTSGFRTLRKKDDFEDNDLDLSLFVFLPGLEVWEGLWEMNTSPDNGKVVFTRESLSTWLENQAGTLKKGFLADDVVAKFSVRSGTLMTDQIYSPIIQFVDSSQDKKLVEQIEAISKKLDLNLPEKLITALWMEIFRLGVFGIMRNPTVAPSIRREMTENLDKNYKNEPIAIIGMSCRMPGANSLEEFWNLLYEGQEAIREPPAYRWMKEHVIRVSPRERGTNAGFLSTPVDEFDARFFGVSPKEAAYMDPQARILHEVIWESLEDSGIDPLSLHGTHTGIFTGSWMNDYKDIVTASTEADFFRTYMGNSIGATAARLSFLLGLTGPNIATESGCSSAIVAVDLAVKSLRSAECNLAVASGVNLFLHPFCSEIMDFVISPDGRCKTFEEKADGFGRAEGCGVFVLKRLSDALQNQDNIWGIIRGSAVSQEGLSRSLGTPTVHCEALAMQLALKDANVKPEQVTFVETHGTGTPVGDPMETAAIAKAYYSPAREQPLVIGSVKTNVGHTESCSGITGMMKVILAMQHDLIPKHLNLETLNPEIFLDSIPAVIPLENLPWPKTPGIPRIAGVSSFGITGTDGHVIIQEAPDYELPQFKLPMERPTHLIKISAKSADALEDLLKSYENLFLDRAEKQRSFLGGDDFANSCYTANIGRANFNHCCFLLADNYQTAGTILQERKFFQSELREGDNRQICFLFTGQGSQYPGMAKLLYETSPVFRVHFDICDKILRDNYQVSIKNCIWGGDEDSKELSRTIYSQTSIFCVEYCLWKLWTSWGIKPDYVVGHSLGEFCAAVAAGLLNFKDAIKLVAERSLLIDSLPRGSMLVVKASKVEVEKMLKLGKVELDFAAINTSEQTVVAGDTSKVVKFKEFLTDRGVKSIILEATHAFHSCHMDPILERYRKVAETIEYKESSDSVQYISGMEGKILTETNADYWVRHTREKVSFMDACRVLKETECQDYIEIGPQPVLATFVMMNVDHPSPVCLPSLRKGTNEWETILTSLGKLYLSGHCVNWKGFDEPYKRNKVQLPFHPFLKKSFWVDCSASHAPMIHPLVGYPLSNASNLYIFQNDLSLKSLSYLKDHCIGPRIVFPGAGYTEMCLSAGYCMANGLTDTLETPRHAMSLQNLRIDAPMELHEDKVSRMQALVDLPVTDHEGSGQQGFQVRVFHQNNSNEGSGKWVLHASSTFVPVVSPKEFLTKWSPSRIRKLMATGGVSSCDRFYKSVDDSGLKFGPNFKMLIRSWAKEEDFPEEIVTEMGYPTDHSKYLVHPLIIDAVFQAAILTKHQRNEDIKLKVPVRIGQLIVFPAAKAPEPNTKIYFHAWVKNDKHYVFIGCGDEEELHPIAYVEDVELFDTSVKTIQSILEQQSSRIPDAFEEIWKVIPSPFVTFVDPLPEERVKAIPNFAEIVERLRISEGTEDDNRLMWARQRLISLYILKAFYELGWSPTVNDTFDLIGFCNTLGIKENFHQMVRFYICVGLGEILGLVKKSGTFGSETFKIVVQPDPYPTILEEIDEILVDLKKSAVRPVTLIDEHMAISLAKCMSGEDSPLALLFPTDEEKMHLSADGYYKNHPSRPHIMGLTGLVAQTFFEQSYEVNKDQPNKVYRVLEVGAGTGSLTAHMLKRLKDIWGDRFELYYTDISQGFFVKAEKRFEEYKQNMKFAVFNIEQSPIGQGIPLEYFDMVTATDVLHATRYLDETLIHLRQTLRPGGILCFIETIIPAIDITWIFGLLEGYWRFQDFSWRPDHCCVGTSTWEKVMNQTGYENVHCYETYFKQFGCITGVASPSVSVESLVPICAPEVKSQQWIVFAGEENKEVVERIVAILDVSGYEAIIVRRKGHETGNFRVKKSTRCVSILADNDDPHELEQLFSCKSDEDWRIYGVLFGWGMDLGEREQRKLALPFLHLAKILVGTGKPPQLFIMSQGVHGAVYDDCVAVSPSSAAVFGMAKSLKNENSDMMIRYVDLDQTSSPEQMAEQMVFELGMTKGYKENLRVQIAYRSKLRYEPRFVRCTLQLKDDELKLPQSTDRYKLVLPGSKLISDLEFDILEEEEIVEGQVEVKMKAYALNFKDVLTVIKPSQEFEELNVFGMDFSGVVTKVGGTSKFKVGDRVFGCNGTKEAQMPNYSVVDERTLLPMPDSMSFWEASTLPAVFATAYYCLITVGKLKKSDTILIHTASGGVGLAAIQLAKNIGCRIICTAGNPKKRGYLRSLGIEDVFHSRDLTYEQEIMKVTNGRGVDFVLNSITGPGCVQASLNSCAKGARFIEMSRLNIWSDEEVKQTRPDVEYTIVYLGDMKAEDWQGLLGALKEYVDDGIISALPFVKFDAVNIRQALNYMQKARHIGKVVVAIPEIIAQGGEFRVKVPLFNEDSSYLITGGLGGIGFEVGKWMLQRGANEIILNARRPPSAEVLEEIKRLTDAGNKVHVKLGDVGDVAQCGKILKEIFAECKPLRGIMHCAGVIRDNLFTSQTWDQYMDCFRPKVYGTWNLHDGTRHLQLEHFVMYSSISALAGTPGQSNHAASNSFEDAFVHYRHSMGLSGTSVNWGQWAEVGVAKEINVPGCLPVSTERMLNGLEVTLRTQRRQVCISEYESFANFGILCPMTKGYLHDRLWNQTGSNTIQRGQGLLNADQFWQEMDNAEGKTDKIEVMMSYLRTMLRSALRLEPDEPLGDDSNLQELGVDSLMMIELKNSIQSLVGSRLTVNANMLKNCTTIRLVASAVVGKLLEEGEGDGAPVILDPLPPHELLKVLEEDCLLEEDIQPCGKAPKPSEVKTVLVTGSTGLFAPYVITYLGTHYPAVTKIYCLVKGTVEDTTALAKERLLATFKSLNLSTEILNSKVECVNGDVAKPYMGITDQEKYKTLVTNVQAVFHFALKSNHVEPYRPSEGRGYGDLRSVNVGGLLNILKFATDTTTKLIFYPSLAFCGVFQENEDLTLSDDWPDKEVVETLVDHNAPGLLDAKIVCEMLLRQANERGVPCKIFRFPPAAGDSKTGQINHLNNLYIIRYLSFLKVGAMPSLPLPANVLPVDLCTEYSLKLFFNDEAPNEIFNINHPRAPVEQVFVQVAKEEFGKDLEIVESNEFLARMEETDTDLENYKELYKGQGLIMGYVADAVGIVKSYAVNPGGFFESRKVKKFLPKYGEGVPPAVDIIRKDLRHLKEIGFVEKFGI